MTKSPTPAGERPLPLHYEIRLAGRLDERWTAFFDDPTMRFDADGTSLMSLTVADQAALHGVLQRVRDLGLTLVHVAHVDGASEPAADATDHTVPERSSR